MTYKRDGIEVLLFASLILVIGLLVCTVGELVISICNGTLADDTPLNPTLWAIVLIFVGGFIFGICFDYYDNNGRVKTPKYQRKCDKLKAKQEEKRSKEEYKRINLHYYIKYQKLKGINRVCPKCCEPLAKKAQYCSNCGHLF